MSTGSVKEERGAGHPLDAHSQGAELSVVAAQKDALELAFTGASLDASLGMLIAAARDIAGEGAGALIFDSCRDGAGLGIISAADSLEAPAQSMDWIKAGPHAPPLVMAALDAQPAIASDIARDARWATHLDLARAQGIGAWWSLPIQTEQGESLATLAVYHRAPRQATQADLEPLQRLARTAGLIIGAPQQAEQRTTSDQGLLQREPHWRDMIDAIPAAVYTTDAEGGLTHFNPAAVELSGNIPSLGTDHWCVTWKLYHPDGKPMPHDQCPMAVALREGRPVFGEEATLERPDGQRISFQPYPAPLFDDAGDIVGGINLLVDITERKRAEAGMAQATAESERQRRLYETIISNTPDLVYVFGLDCRFLFANEALLQMWGRTLEDSVNKRLLEVGYEPWHAELHEREIDQVIATKAPVRGVVPFNHATLGRRIYDYILVPVLNEHGEVEAVAGTTRDVTDQTRAQEALQEHQEQLAAELDAMRRLHELSLHLMQEDQLEAGLHEVMTASAQLLYADKASVQTYNERDNKLTLVSAIGFDEAFRDRFDSIEPDGFTTCAEAVRRREKVVVSDLSVAPEFAKLEEATRPYGIRAALSVPLSGSDGQLYGVFSMYWDQPHTPTQRELQLLDLYTQQASRQVERQHAQQALRESEEHLQAIVQTTPECVKVVAADGTLLEMNPAGLAMVEVDAASDVTGSSVYRLIAPEHRQHFREFHERICAGESGLIEFDFITARGRRRHMEAHAVPMRNRDGSIAQLALAHDITQRRQTEVTRARLSAIVDSSDDAIISKDLNGIITSWNTSACRLFGYTEEEAIGRSVTMLIPAARADEEPRILARLKRGERVDHFETVRVRKDGAKLDISLTISPIKDSQGRVVGASKIARDITERKRIERALLESEQRLKEMNRTLEQRVAERTAELARRADELRRLTAELNTAEQRERRELAQVLHDNLQQVLAAARMRIDIAMTGVEDKNVGGRLREATAYIDQTIEGMRTLATELSPPMLYHDGLVPTLRWLARHVEESYGLHVELQAEDLRGALSNDLRAFVFQSIRELTFNIVKHAETDRARITVTRANEAAGGYLEVTVEDDGKGCDVDAVAARGGEGFGLTSIRERLFGLGGEFLMKSSESTGGCRIEMRIPLSRPESHW